MNALMFIGNKKYKFLDRYTIFLGSDGTIDNDNIISSNLSRLKGMYSNYDVRISNPFVNNGEVTYYIYL